MRGIFASYIIRKFRDGAFEALLENLSENECELHDLVETYEDETGVKVVLPLGRENERGVELEDPAFSTWCKHEIEQRAEIAAQGIISNLACGNILAWRAVVAPVGWNPRAAHVGIHWSYTKEKAQPIFGDIYEGRQVFLIQAELPLSSIDWDRTIKANLSAEFGVEEDEVTILESAPYDIVSVEILSTNEASKNHPASMSTAPI